MRSVGRIESPLYFPCGSYYYHGGADLLAGHSGPVILFHEILREWYSPERVKRVFDQGRFGEFAKAKIFASIGRARNEPLSIADMRGDQHFVLVPRVKLLCGEIDSDLPYSQQKEERLREEIGAAVIAEVEKVADLDKVVFLPNFPKSFTLPLSTVFQFEWLKASKFAMLGRLVEKDRWEVPERDSIDEEFKAVGGFLKSRSVVRAVTSDRSAR